MTNINFQKSPTSTFTQLTIEYADGTHQVSRPTDAFLKQRGKGGQLITPSQKDWTELAEAIINGREYKNVVVS
jgi:hypothetical protein